MTPTAIAMARRFSIQRDSQLLAERCAAGLQLVAMRERLADMFERLERAA